MIADESTWQKQNGAFMYAEKTDDFFEIMM